MQNNKNTNFGCTNELFHSAKFLENYNSDIVRQLCGDNKSSKNVLDFGAGIGTLSILWERLFNIKPDCLEIDDNQKNIITERGYQCYSRIGDLNKKYDLIYSSNVFEHIEDDVSVMKTLKSYLAPGGIISIYVPACRSLYSYFDEYAGHYRRYQRRELINKLNEAGFVVLQCRFVDVIGFFSWFYIKLVGKRIDLNESQLVSNKSLILYDRWIYPLSRIIDKIGMQYLFGKNLLIIAKNIK
jgi:SAM-dependent methyltransferase